MLKGQLTSLWHNQQHQSTDSKGNSENHILGHVHARAHAYTQVADNQSINEVPTY